MNQRLWLKNARLRNHMSSKQIAEKIDISEDYYRQIEAGERQKKLDKMLVIKLSDALGMIPQEIEKAESDTFFLVNQETVLALDAARNMINCILYSNIDEISKETALFGVSDYMDHICLDIEENEIRTEQDACA